MSIPCKQPAYFITYFTTEGKAAEKNSSCMLGMLMFHFYLESHCIQRVACFWYDEKNNIDERDTRLKR